MLHELITLVVCLGVASSRDTTKTFKSLPAISNSLVNLGKMDISFHFNTKFPEVPPLPVAEIKTDPTGQPSSSFFFSKSEPLPVEEPCLCSSFKNMKNNFLSNPSEILNKILMSNDHFSSKDPVSSISCCDSHEHVQEDTVFFEFGPKQSQNDISPMQSNSMPMLPFIFENLIPSRPTRPVQPIKPKAIEIFFFPKKKELSPFEYGKIPQKKKESPMKSEIQIVGDKELRNDFKTFKFRPSIPVSSVAKKDLNAENVEKKVTENSTDDTSKPTVSNLNVI